MANVPNAETIRSAAKLLNDNEIWQDALDAIVANYNDMWVNSEPVEQTRRENAYYMIQAVGKLRTEIKTMCNAGSLNKQIAQNNVKSKG
jgi:hypothetical protein